jgi:hypothetical protein
MQGVTFLEKILHQLPFWWWCFSKILEKSIKNIQSIFYVLDKKYTIGGPIYYFPINFSLHY